ncbi:hypothetical protein OH492_28700 [Vibrio chagasii]|nr:hypothetical protein [Vibrio chagasii]
MIISACRVNALTDDERLFDEASAPTPAKWYQKVDAKLNVLSGPDTLRSLQVFDRKSTNEWYRFNANCVVCIGRLEDAPAFFRYQKIPWLCRGPHISTNGVGRQYHLDNNQQLNSGLV